MVSRRWITRSRRSRRAFKVYGNLERAGYLARPFHFLIGCSEFDLRRVYDSNAMQPLLSGRAKITETSDRLILEIPSRKQWFVVIFLAVWLSFWFLAVASVVPTMLTNTSFRSGPSLIFLVVWLFGFVGGGVFGLYIWIKLTFGLEISEFSSASISIGEKILFYERGQSFDSHSILRLRGLPVSEPSWFDQRHLWTGGAASLGFDYGSRTIRFGRGIDEAEATQLLERIITKFPEYQSVRLSPSPWNQSFQNRI